jgi:hypothetical protein
MMAHHAVHTPTSWRSPPFPNDYPPNGSEKWSTSSLIGKHKFTANLFKPSTTSTPPTHPAYDGLRHIWNSIPTFLTQHPGVSQTDCFPNIPFDTQGVIYVMYCIAKTNGTPLLYVGQTKTHCFERLRSRFIKIRTHARKQIEVIEKLEGINTYILKHGKWKYWRILPLKLTEVGYNRKQLRSKLNSLLRSSPYKYSHHKNKLAAHAWRRVD